ncbi:MAG: hypothetical protein K2J90_15020 [Lachnospiraceae bacterium]|nr:hypothetical protein [Lachnospiraceae bacterium]
MKKLFVCMVSVVMLAVLTACGNEVKEDREQPGGTENFAMSDDAETGTDHDMEEQKTDSTETESEDINEEEDHMDNTMKITAGDTTFTATFADNSSAEALKELLAEGPLTISMSDYASMEKVGPIGTSLPRNDEQTTTGAGDIILYQGNSLVIYYGTNSWNFTRIGKINDVTQAELLEAFGDGDVTVMFSLN